MPEDRHFGCFWSLGGSNLPLLYRNMNLPPRCLQVESEPQVGGLRHHHMPDWIAKANIEHFRKLLETEKDPRTRAVIELELAEEEAKLAELLKKPAERKEG
jgi:hypothetical protein